MYVSYNTESVSAYGLGGKLILNKKVHTKYSHDVRTYYYVCFLLDIFLEKYCYIILQVICTYVRFCTKLTTEDLKQYKCIKKCMYVGTPIHITVLSY